MRTLRGSVLAVYCPSAGDGARVPGFLRSRAAAGVAEPSSRTTDAPAGGERAPPVVVLVSAAGPAARSGGRRRVGQTAVAALRLRRARAGPGVLRATRSSGSGGSSGRPPGRGGRPAPPGPRGLERREPVGGFGPLQPGRVAQDLAAVLPAWPSPSASKTGSRPLVDVVDGVALAVGVYVEGHAAGAGADRRRQVDNQRVDGQTGGAAYSSMKPSESATCIIRNRREPWSLRARRSPRRRAQTAAGGRSCGEAGVRGQGRGAAVSSFRRGLRRGGRERHGGKLQRALLGAGLGWRLRWRGGGHDGGREVRRAGRQGGGHEDRRPGFPGEEYG